MVENWSPTGFEPTTVRSNLHCFIHSATRLIGNYPLIVTLFCLKRDDLAFDETLLTAGLAITVAWVPGTGSEYTTFPSPNMFNILCLYLLGFRNEKPYIRAKNCTVYRIKVLIDCQHLFILLYILTAVARWAIIPTVRLIVARWWEVQSRFAETRFAETPILTLTLNPNP